MVKKGRELKEISRALFNFLFAVQWQLMIVLAVIPIVQFSEICLPHPSTTAPLMFLPISKNFANH